MSAPLKGNEADMTVLCVCVHICSRTSDPQPQI